MFVDPWAASYNTSYLGRTDDPVEADAELVDDGSELRLRCPDREEYDSIRRPLRPSLKSSTTQLWGELAQPVLTPPAEPRPRERRRRDGWVPRDTTPV